MDGLEQVAADLYAGSPEEFVAARTDAVKAARAAGDKPLATAIGRLRKPTRTAWVVNLLARHEPDDLAALLELGAALREAQENLSGADLRRLSTERRRAVDALADRAVTLGRDEGYAAADAARQEVSQTLQAGLADPDLGDQIRRGVVATAATSGGFGPFSLGEATPAQTSPPSPTASTAAPAAPASKGAKAAKAARAPDAKKARALDQARAAAAEASSAETAEQERHAAAVAAAETATQEADHLATRADDLRAQLEEVETAAKQAGRVARQARKAAEASAQAHGAARDAATAAATRLADLDGD